MAAAQMILTADLILAMVILVLLFLVMLWITQVLSMVRRVRDQMAANPDITEMKPNICKYCEVSQVKSVGSYLELKNTYFYGRVYQMPKGLIYRFIKREKNVLIWNPTF